MGVMPWQPEAEPRQMFEQARIACNLGRGQAADRLVIYDDKIRKKDEVNQRLLVDIRRAVEEHQFEVYYQPKYDIRQAKPVLASAEALVRWRHPEYGLVMPDSFIPLLENIGLITTVDKFVWGEAARQVASWKETYGVSVPISVNLSRVDLFDPALERTLEDLLKKNGLSHSEFKLEVTESACTENEVQVIDVVERLRRRGFEIEMDDFGTGYSSLSMLSSMPVDVLKMDRAFVSNIETEEKDRQLVELILSLARKLKIPVVAEGVETEEQLKLLRELGCPLVQGFYFSKPLPADEFEEKVIRKMQETGKEDDTCTR
jgi:EAL domain-containing protein (putative c-di-GMP-specific phosphodiesterase class I)